MSGESCDCAETCSTQQWIVVGQMHSIVFYCVLVHQSRASHMIRNHALCNMVYFLYVPVLC